MAKWGEGDPRWIVEQREDGINVNNWHWTEKDATQWSKTKIKSLLTNLVIENEKYNLVVTDVSKCEGEAVANNRKSKLIFFYEWVIEASWEGYQKDSKNRSKYKGKFEIPNLSEENSADEIDVSVSTDSSSSVAQGLKEYLYREGSKKVRETMSQYIKELKEEYSKGMILPSKVTQPAASVNKDSTNTKIVQEMKKGPQDNKKSTSNGTLKSISLSEEFYCTPDDLYKVFTTEELTSAFTRSQAKLDPCKGGAFTFWGGNVCGTFSELTPCSKIVMNWRRSNWPENHFSKVTMELTATDRGTRLSLEQKNMYESEAENAVSGWQSNFFQAIKRTFGYGDNLF